MERKSNVMVLIDASNIHYARKFTGGLLNMGNIKPYFTSLHDAGAVSVFFYSAYPGIGTRPDEDIQKKHDFFTLLQKRFGFTVRKKQIKVIESDRPGVGRIEKGNLDIEMAIDVMRHIHDFDIFIFFTGDCDFLPVIHEILSLDKKAYIYSTKGAISNELKTGGSGYFDIKDHADLIQKKTPS